METDNSLNTFPDDGLLQTTKFRAYDNVIAVTLFLCFLIGLPGNCLALKYFIQTKKRNLSNCLYIIACCIDICSSCFISLPAAAGLWNGRNPGILGTPIICTAWYYSLMMLQLTSMFVVMLLSVSRAIVIVFPFFKVNKRAVLWSIVGYVLYQSSWNLGRYFDSGTSFYNKPAAYCISISIGTFDTIFNINFNICLAVSPIIVFAAFLVVSLKFRGDGISETSQRNNRQASVTISYFATLFLFCNLPSFLNQTLFVYTTVRYLNNGRYPGPIFSKNFMYYYSWSLSVCFFTVLNAALNPVLYVWRMKNLRTWILRFF